MRDNEWGVSEFPLVAGHKVVGEVIQTGEAVTSLKIGGWLRHRQPILPTKFLML